MFSVMGQEPIKRGEAKAGDTVALRPPRQRQDRRHAHRRQGQEASRSRPRRRRRRCSGSPSPPRRTQGRGQAHRGDRQDHRGGSLALAHHSQDMGEMVLWGQGEMHLRVALERLVRKYDIDASTRAAPDPLSRDHPQVDRAARPPQEAVRRPRPVRRRVVEIKPLPRGAGFEFTDKITGGVVPKQVHPVGRDRRPRLSRARPLGFPVVDVAVCLIDGSYHTVDSSDMAFQPGRRASP